MVLPLYGVLLYIRDTSCITKQIPARKLLAKIVSNGKVQFSSFQDLGIFRATEGAANVLLRCKLSITNFTVLILEKVSVTQEAQ